jgi:hypothetical protein
MKRSFAARVERERYLKACRGQCQRLRRSEPQREPCGIRAGELRLVNSGGHAVGIPQMPRRARLRAFDDGPEVDERRLSCGGRWTKSAATTFASDLSWTVRIGGEEAYSR